MTQQINLLVIRRRHERSSMIALGVIGALVVVLAVWAALLARQAQDLSTQADAAARELARVQETNRRLNATGNAQAASLRSETATMTAKASAQQRLLEQVQTADLGSRDGYAEHFAILGRVIEPDVWLSRISVGGGGKRITLEGRALNHEAMLRYVHRLNEAFASIDVKFGALTIAPDTAAQGAGQRPTLEALKFTLN